MKRSEAELYMEQRLIEFYGYDSNKDCSMLAERIMAWCDAIELMPERKDVYEGGRVLKRGYENE